jgi:cytochrome c-type biogenesis protein
MGAMAVDVNVLTYADALAAGFVSFASPCALALVPGYLSFVSGASYDEIVGTSGGAATVRAGSVVRSTGAFVAGFAAMFALWGAGAGYLGDSLSGDRDTINVVSGVLLVAMGLLMILLPRIGFLQGEKRLTLTKRPTTLVGLGLAGAAFAVAWTPCTGPFLGQVLSLAVPTESPRIGASLLLTYALGLGIPFLLAGLFMTQTMSISRAVRDHWKVINLVAGSVTIALGVLVATGRFTVLTQKISDLGIGL